MPAINENNLPIKAGKLSIATWASGIPALTAGNANANTVVSYIESNFTFERLASLIDLQISTNLSDEVVEVEADECDTGTIYKASRPAISFSATWYESLNLDAMKLLLGEDILNVAGSSTSGNEIKASGAWAFNNPFVLRNQNGDLSQLTITSVTGSVDGLLVDGTDYFVGKNAEGKTVITVIDSTTVTTASQNLDIVYNYIPTATKYTGLKIESKELPRLIARIETCSDDGKVNTYYLVDCGLDGELITPFTNVVRSGDITGSEINLLGNKGGFMVQERKDF